MLLKSATVIFLPFRQVICVAMSVSAASENPGCMLFVMALSAPHFMTELFRPAGAAERFRYCSQHRPVSFPDTSGCLSRKHPQPLAFCTSSIKRCTMSAGSCGRRFPIAASCWSGFLVLRKLRLQDRDTRCLSQQPPLLQLISHLLHETGLSTAVDACHELDETRIIHEEASPPDAVPSM